MRRKPLTGKGMPNGMITANDANLNGFQKNRPSRYRCESFNVQSDVLGKCDQLAWGIAIGQCVYGSPPLQRKACNAPLYVCG
jgi:hypothetical protein